MPEEVSLKELVQRMRRDADANPFHPVAGGNILDFRRDVMFEGVPMKITFTRTVVYTRQFYQFSVGNGVPDRLVERLKSAFVPNGVEIPSVLGNCRQFLEAI